MNFTERNLILLVALLFQFAQVAVCGEEFIKQQLERFGSDCLLKGNGADGGGQQSPDQVVEQLAKIKQDIGRCLQNFDYDEQWLQFEQEFNESGLERTDENMQKLNAKINCRIVSQIMECLEGFENLLKECKHDLGLAAFALLRTTCKDGGNRLYELESMNHQCDVERNPEFQTCTDEIIPRDVSDERTYILNNACKVSSLWKHCFTDALDACDNGKYKKKVGEFLVELRTESPAAARCFFSQG